ncbi:leucyl aminopeptidase family protein [Plantactinospora sp. GCM10030261]|uniref:leucyl aminopeptidase family protein n=1 Tax=Plantactinospora sp. GCM10030261 TaxID=3273420 RepID=UPI00360E6E2A
MLDIGFVAEPVGFDALVLPVHPGDRQAASDAPAVELLPGQFPVPDDLRAEATALLPAVEHSGAAGVAHVSVAPSREPVRLVLVGVGDGDEAGWRAAGAALARSGATERTVAVALPPDAGPAVVRGLAEGLWLASYRFRLPGSDDAAPSGGRVMLAVAGTEAYVDALRTARVTAEMTCFARDLTNMPSSVKSPAWFADQVVTAADRLIVAHQPGGGPDGESAGGPDGVAGGLTVTVREPAELAAAGFGGILAVGGGSASPPRLVELDWHPEDARTHVVLVGKGITFDTGGLSIKPRDAMKLMRKDMGGAAAVIAAALGAAALRLPVRVTALAPLAENMVSGSAFRPGDVIRHYGGRTSESTNSDAEGRLVLADALAYAVDRLAPDVLIDLATLTGANAVALGARTGALYSENHELAESVLGAGAAAGEHAWRMPLPSDYVEYLASEIADLHSSPAKGAGSVIAALYLREFTGELRDRWLHVDMSAPSWTSKDDAELVKGATGWGVRTLLRWLADR